MVSAVLEQWFLPFYKQPQLFIYFSPPRQSGGKFSYNRRFFDISPYVNPYKISHVQLPEMSCV